jgi:hypothetical protein
MTEQVQALPYATPAFGGLIRNVRVDVYRTADDTQIARTEVATQVRWWRVREGDTLRDLAALALAVLTHGDDGRQGPLPLYDGGAS